MIRLLLADDHKLFLDGLSNILGREEDLEIVGVALNGIEVLEILKEISPDVIVMDVTMPEMNGIEATKKVLKAYPKIKIIALSMHANKGIVSEMLKAGAMGYILKEGTSEEFLHAIRTINSGQAYLTPKITSVIVDDYLRLLSSTYPTAASRLSSRELEVLKLLVNGENTKAIARSLNISKNTVDTHRRNILDKLDCTNIAELTRYAIREGLVGLDD